MRRVNHFKGGSRISEQRGRSDYRAGGGVYNMICDRCGFKCKSTQIKREWTGLYVCDSSVNDCWEPRQPQDFVRGIPDRQSVPVPRPDMNNSQPQYWPYPCIAGIAIAGLSVCGTGYIKSGVEEP